MTEFGVLTKVGRSMFLGDHPYPHPKGAAPASPKFLGPYLRPNRLTQSNEIWYDNTWRSHVFLGVSHAPSPSVPQKFSDFLHARTWYAKY